MKRFNLLFPILLLLFIHLTTGCKKLIEVDGPPTSINEENVYKTDATAIALLTGVYINISNDNRDFLNGISRMTFYPALSADELSLASTNLSDEFLGFYRNTIKSNQISGSFYEKSYRVIYTVNSAIAGISKSTLLTPGVKKQLLGEAYFIRAFYYLNLTNMFGGVPLVTSTDYSQTAELPRSTVNDIYIQIKADLIIAQSLLNTNYIGSTMIETSSERVRPNSFAATSLLARVYLYMKDYINAEIEATKVINNKGLYDTLPLISMFLKNSKETVWAIQPVGIDANSNTGEGKLWLVPSTGFDNNRRYYLDSEFLKAFEVGDMRRKIWVDSILLQGNYYKYPAKYKVGQIKTSTTEYPIILRLAEQYLIRAEARIQLNKITDGITDLNVLRARSTDTTVPNNEQLKQLSTVLSKEAAINAVLHERQVELFTEWGHRWIDLRRTATIDAVMSIAAVRKGGTWNSEKAIYPIPLTILQNNVHLVQNPGYE